MKFKDPGLQPQFNELPVKLQEIALFFDQLTSEMGLTAVVTRVWDPVPGDSGVHEAHRAVDFRDETTGADGKPVYLYTADQVNYITAYLNNLYPRDDGKPTCLHHSFEGGEFHFHLQIPFAWLEPEERH